MNKEQKKKLSEYISEKINELIESSEDIIGPTWATPVVWLSEEGMFFSLTEEDEYDVAIPWDDFEQWIIASDDNLIEEYLPKFERLVANMKKTIDTVTE